MQQPWIYTKEDLANNLGSTLPLDHINITYMWVHPSLGSLEPSAQEI